MSKYAAILRRSKPVFLTPRNLLEAAVSYFEWADDHPLLEEQVWQYKGSIVRTDAAKMRAFTRQGLASHLGITTRELTEMAGRGGDWEEALTMIDEAIYQQKFEGAAAGLLNAGMITRDLGLAEKQEVNTGVTVVFSDDDADL